MTNYTTYQLSRLAECGDPDVPDYTSFPHHQGEPHAEPSPGAQFLHLVANDLEDAKERIASGEDRGDVVHELADADVPVYTHEMWKTFVDLTAYNEDISGYGGYFGDDLNKAAGVALFMIAERLLNALLDAEEEDD